MRMSIVFCVLFKLCTAETFKIWDIWQTASNQSTLFKALDRRPPLEFTEPGTIGQGNIVVADTTTYQQVVGLGGTLTDSSALLLNNLKTKNSTNYWNLLNYLFSAQETANSAGFSYVRLPMGSSDFAATTYSYDDVANDTCFNEFNIDSSPPYVFSVLSDIQAVNSAVRFHVVPWSPPAWMKDGGTMRGGTLRSDMIPIYASYLLKGLQAFKRKGVQVYAVSIQNEGSYTNPTYPTSTLSYVDEAKIGIALKTLMLANGFPKTKLIGNEDNWSEATNYAVQLMEAGGDAFDGVSFHCYGGSVAQQGAFHKLYPKKEIYFTECSGVLDSDWWNDIKVSSKKLRPQAMVSDLSPAQWYTDNVFMGAIENSAKATLMWNIALDGKGEPRLPGTASCGNPGCRGIVTINSNGTWVANQEFYAMAQISKAIIPRDIGGSSGRRIKTTVTGKLSWALRVVGFVTLRSNASDYARYSLVVMNWNDNANTTSIKTTMLFRGVQATYVFPLGLTTLWWYASPMNSSATEYDIVKESNGAPSRRPLQFTDQSDMF